MKRVRAKLRLMPDSASSGRGDDNDLRVRISRSVAEELSVGSTPDDGTLALVDPENVALTCPGLFVDYAVVGDREVPSSASSGDAAALFVTREFLKRRRGWGEGQAVDVLCGVRCPRLTKVSLLARSAEAYARLNSPSLWEALGGGERSDGILCRMDDSLAAFGGDAVLVVDCEPTRQGLIVPETQVVVIRPSLEYTPAGDTGSCDDVVKLAGTILYTSRILQSTHRTKRDRSVAAGIAASTRRRAPGLLRVHILPQLPEHNVPTTADPLNCVFLGRSTMAALGLAEGSWAQAWLQEPGGHSSTSSDTQLKRQVAIWSTERLHMLESELASGLALEDAAYLSPHLWFHLHDRDRPALLVRPTARLHLEALAGSSKGSQPVSAHEFYLAIVRSPAYSSTIECTALLRDHFSRPRYICKGDIVTINLRGSPCSEEYLPDGSSQRNHVVFFKATQLLGPDNNAPGYFCDINTMLYQAGSKGCYVPAAMATYHRQWAPHPVWDSPQPPHLAPAVERLQSILLPFLQSGPLRQRVPPCVLLSGSHGCGKRTTLAALTRSLGLHHYQVNCQQLLGDTAAAAETRIKNALMKAQQYTPCLLQLSNVEVFSQDRDVGSGGDPRVVRCLGDTLRALNSEPDEPPVAVVATTAADPDALHPDLAPLLLHTIEIPYPNEEGRAQLLDGLLWSLPKNNSVDISYLAQRTAGFNLGDLCALVGQATARAYARLTRSCSSDRHQGGADSEAGVCVAGPLLMQSDLESALEWLQSSQAQAVGAPRIPCVHWEDVGGLADAKRTLTDTLQLPLRHPQLLDAGLKRSGVLLYGPPGTGKTLLAKAVATECALSFLSVKGPELINMYVGQSEENVRAVFARARSAAPCVIFFDELDSLAPNRGRSGDSGGVMDRVVSQLLAEMDGLNKTADLFVIGATNRPDLLDPAILRPGRFDQLLYVGIPSDKESQLKILKALTRKFRFAKGLDLASVVDECPPGLTGADFYSLSSSAMVRAMKRHIDQLERGLAAADDHHFQVTLEDFQAALKDLVPSVSPEELAHYKDIQQKLAVPKAVTVTT